MNGARCVAEAILFVGLGPRSDSAFRSPLPSPPFRPAPPAQANPEVADHAELQGISPTSECLSVKEPLVERIYSASTDRGPMAAMSPINVELDDEAAAALSEPPPLDASKLPPSFHCVPAKRLTTVSDVALGGCTAE